MTLLGTALRSATTRVMLLGSGELGKGVAIGRQCLGVEVIAVDHYPDAPAMHVAHRSYVISMLDGEVLRQLVKCEKPRYIVLETEAIATDTLIKLEQEGQHVVPCVRATQLTMNREGIRRLAAEELSLSISSFRFVGTETRFREATVEIGYPCIVKLVMSSPGKGQSFIRSADQLTEAWNYAQQGGRASAGRVIAEGIMNFDFEVTPLVASAVDGMRFCVPVGHHQEDDDYRESWQPQQMSDLALVRAQEAVRRVVLALGGHGPFGVELFVCGDEVTSSEVSPRPHDTGMVTLISQDLSEFALHVRAFLGLPVGGIRQYGPSVSAAILPQPTSQSITLDNVQTAVGVGMQVRFSGKLEIDGSRRLGVMLATAQSAEDAVIRAKDAAAQVEVIG